MKQLEFDAWNVIDEEETSTWEDGKFLHNNKTNEKLSHVLDVF